MRAYELMIVFDPDFDYTDVKKREELVSKLLSDQVVTELEQTDLGKKRLAYEINKKLEGFYLLMTFKTNAFNLSAFEQQVKLHNESVMRYLLTRKDK